MSRWRQTGDGGILSGEKLKDKKEREREKIKEGSEVTRSQKEPEAEASAGGGGWCCLEGLSTTPLRLPPSGASSSSLHPSHSFLAPDKADGDR